MPERAREMLDRAGAMAERVRVEAGASGTPAPAGTPMAARSFGLCFTGGGENCVGDGDTSWIDGEKVCVAEIEAPETHPSPIPEEARTGNREDHGEGKGGVERE